MLTAWVISAVTRKWSGYQSARAVAAEMSEASRSRKERSLVSRHAIASVVLRLDNVRAEASIEPASDLSKVTTAEDII